MLALKDGSSSCEGGVPTERYLRCWGEPPEIFTELNENACQAFDAQNGHK